MSKTGIWTSVFGLLTNFILFLIKLYVSISSGSLAIYCDSINNLGDTASCAIALAGFVLALKLSEQKSNRAQALASFVIGLILAVTSFYFAYNGIERLIYPTPISYQVRYAVLIAFTVLVKLVMGIVYSLADKKKPSPVLKTLKLDSFLDFAITLSTLLSLTLAAKINFAIDSVISIAIGAVIAVSSLRSIITQSKFLIND